MVKPCPMCAKWFGGFFDGEGCVSLRRASSGHGGYSWRLTVSVSQKDKRVLAKIKRWVDFGGSISTYSRGSNLEWTSSQAEWVLRLLLPVCTVKHKVIKLALRHRHLILPNGGHGKPISKWRFNQHRKLAREISRLNRAN